jgi:hypothetical protein
LYIFLGVGRKTTATLNFATNVLNVVSEAEKWGVPNLREIPARLSQNTPSLT